MKKKMQLLLAMAISMSTGIMAQTIVDTGFTSPYFDGDLAGQQGWAAASGTGANAFNVTDSAGSGFADTTSALLDTNNDNYVYLDSSSLGSAAGDEWDGVMDFTISSTTNTVDFSDFLRLGLSTVSSNSLNVSGDQVTLRLRANGPSGTISIRTYGDVGNIVLMDVDKTAIGWDPEASDQVTDNLRLSWKFRETTVTNTYTMICSLENLTNPGTNMAQGISIIRSGAYEASGLYTLIGRPSQANIFDTEETINVTIDNLSLIKSSAQPVKLYPTPVMALAGDAVVDLSWAEVAEASSYDIKRSNTIDGVYSTLASGLTTNGYQDATVVNGNEYYYKVTSVNGAVSADSDPVVAISDVAKTGDILDTSFTAAEGYSDGDLAGQKNWQAMSATGAEAFNVDSSSNGYAETMTFSNSFDTVNGNYVYYGQSITNSANGQLNGSVTFRLECSPTPGLFETNIVGSITNVQQVASLGNANIFNFGLSSDTDTLFTGNQSDDVAIMSRIIFNGGLQFIIDGDTGSSMLSLDRTDLGWDPQWADANETNTPIFLSEWITLDWSIRKSPQTDLYALTVDATINGAPYSGDTRFTTADIPTDLYAVESAQFCMGHHQAALTKDEGAGNGNIHANVDSVSATHATGVGLPAVAPYDLVASVGNLMVSLDWSGGVEAESFDIYRSDTDPGSLAFYTNVTENTFTDSGLEDKRSYMYQVYAVYAGSVLSAPSEMVVVRALANIDVLEWESLQTDPNPVVTGAGNLLMTPSPTTNGVVNLFGAGDDGSAVSVSGGYNTNDCPLLRCVLQYLDGGEVQKNSIIVNNPPAIQHRLKVNNQPASCLVWVEGDSVDATADNPALEVDTNGDVRAAIRNGSAWYVSEQIFSGLGVIPDLTAVNWTELELATATSAQLMTMTGATFAPVAGLTDINAIGVFRETDAGQNSVTTHWKLIVGSKPTLYNLWTDQYGIYNDQAAATNDYDFDGRNNVWEWGLGGNPDNDADVGIAAYVELGTDESGNFIYIYPRLMNELARPDYYLTESDNLVFTGFTDQEGEYTITAGGIWPGESDFEAVTNVIPTTDTVKFIQLKIE